MNHFLLEALVCVPGSRREKERAVWKRWAFVTDFSDTPCICPCFPVSQAQKDPAAQLREQSTAPTALACMESCECHLPFPALKQHKSIINPQKMHREALDGAKILAKGLKKKTNQKASCPAEEGLWTTLVQHLTCSGSFRPRHGHTWSHDTAASDKNEVNKVDLMLLSVIKSELGLDCLQIPR